MRRRSLRFDIWVCLLAAYLVGFGVGKIMDQINSSRYEEYVEEHTAKEGDVGSKAGKNVVRVNNIKELLENKTLLLYLRVISIVMRVEATMRGNSFRVLHYLLEKE